MRLKGQRSPSGLARSMKLRDVAGCVEHASLNVSAGTDEQDEPCVCSLHLFCLLHLAILEYHISFTLSIKAEPLPVFFSL